MVACCLLLVSLRRMVPISKMTSIYYEYRYDFHGLCLAVTRRAVRLSENPNQGASTGPLNGHQE
jgi:hypothetical protein